MIGLRYGAVVTVAEISSQMGEFKPMLPIGKETMIPVSYTHLDVYKRQALGIMTDALPL